MSNQNTSRKIFVSYKHSDSSVAPLDRATQQYEMTQARHYVAELEELLKDENHIYKGERDNEPLDQFKDETIESKLKQKIFDSSLTIVLISKNMKNLYENESDQWIPWEISYSLKEMTKNGVTSKTNAMLAVVLPDENNSYTYMVNHLPCVIRWNTADLFSILNRNMFNRNNKNTKRCEQCGGYHHIGDDHSYVHPVKWYDFIRDMNSYIDYAYNLNDNIQDYDLRKLC